MIAQMNSPKRLLTAFFAVSIFAAAPAPVTIQGWVIDSSCTFTQNLAKPISAECAVACARKGSPLVIQTPDGTIYLPIAGKMPAAGQNARLMRFAGREVTVTGVPYQRGGSHAIVIQSIALKK
jgi:hypothetical protein